MPAGFGSSRTRCSRHATMRVTVRRKRRSTFQRRPCRIPRFQTPPGNKSELRLFSAPLSNSLPPYSLRGGGERTVTYNLKDFPNKYLSNFGLEAQHPDEFVTHVWDLNPGAVCAAAKKQRAGFKNPPMTAKDFLPTLAQQRLPETVSRLSEFAELI